MSVSQFRSDRGNISRSRRLSVGVHRHKFWLLRHAFFPFRYAQINLLYVGAGTGLNWSWCIPSLLKSLPLQRTDDDLFFLCAQKPHFITRDAAEHDIDCVALRSALTCQIDVYFDGCNGNLSARAGECWSCKLYTAVSSHSNYRLPFTVSELAGKIIILRDWHGLQEHWNCNRTANR